MRCTGIAALFGLTITALTLPRVAAEDIPFAPGTPFFAKYSGFTSIIGSEKELRTVLRLTSFTDTSLSETFPVTPGEEVTALIGDLVLDGVIRGGTRLSAGTPVKAGDVMAFKPGGRNPVVGDNRSFDNVTSDRGADSGGFFEVYNGLSPDFSAAGGPSAWTPGVDGHDAAALDGTLGAGFHDGYPTVNEPTIWLQGVFESLTAYDSAVGGLLGFSPAAGYLSTDVYALSVFVSPSPGLITFGSAQYVLNITGGSVADSLDVFSAGPFNGGPLTPGFDLSGSMVLTANPTGNGWGLLSNDPLGGIVAVPEPSSLAMCISLLAVGGFCLIRRAGSTA